MSSRPVGETHVAQRRLRPMSQAAWRSSWRGHVRRCERLGRDVTVFVLSASGLSGHLNGRLVGTAAASRRSASPAHVAGEMAVMIELSGRHFGQLALGGWEPIWPRYRRSALVRDARHPAASVPAPTPCDRSGHARAPVGHLQPPPRDAGRSRRMLMQEQSSTMSNVT